MDLTSDVSQRGKLFAIVIFVVGCVDEEAVRGEERESANNELWHPGNELVGSLWFLLEFYSPRGYYFLRIDFCPMMEETENGNW